jgi:hypothetical protein
VRSGNLSGTKIIFKTNMIEGHGVEYARHAIRLETDTMILKVHSMVIKLISIGATRDHSTSFIQTRKKVVDRTYLEVNRLEKRLTRVTTFNIQLTISFWP